jgi:hypothetical protein
MSACRRHYPGRFDGTDSLITAPPTSTFPTLQLGRLLHHIFRGLLSVHSRYNLQTRRVALCDPLHRRLRRFCCLHRRSDCYRVERSSSRTGLSPAVIQRLSRRTEIESRVENRRSCFSLPVAVGMLSHDRLNPVWLDPVSCSPGRAVARPGLRMMPASPPLPLKFRRADFLRYGFKAGISEGAFPSTTRSSRRSVCLHPSCSSSGASCSSF